VGTEEEGVLPVVSLVRHKRKILLSFGGGRVVLETLPDEKSSMFVFISHSKVSSTQ